MRRSLLAIAPLVLAALLLGVPRRAEAGIPVIYGTGERVDKVADLPPDHPALRAMGNDAAVGYMYWHLHVYWCPFWTSSGEFVVYQGDRVVPLGNDLDAVSRDTGVPKEKLRRPWLSIIPLGWLIIGGFVAVGVVAGRINARHDPEARLARLMKQPLYREALEDAHKETDLKLAYERAVTYLMGRGVAEAKARDDMALIFQAMILSAQAEAAEAAQAEPAPEGAENPPIEPDR